MTHEKYLAKIRELEAEVASLTAQLIVSNQRKTTEIHTHYHYPNKPVSYQPYWSTLPQTQWGNTGNQSSLHGGIQFSN